MIISQKSTLSSKSPGGGLCYEDIWLQTGTTGRSQTQKKVPEISPLQRRKISEVELTMAVCLPAFVRFVFFPSIRQRFQQQPAEEDISLTFCRGE